MMRKLFGVAEQKQMHFTKRAATQSCVRFHRKKKVELNFAKDAAEII